MSLLQLPEEVIEGHILPWLEWNDLVRLRRVCSATHWIATEYMLLHPELAPEMEINEQEKSFTAFLDLGIVTKKLFLKNQSGYGFYQKDAEGITKFLAKYGEMIEHLRVEELSMSIFGKEWDFLETLVNLKSLQAKRLDGLGEIKRSEGEMSWRLAQQQLFQLAMEDTRFKNNPFPFPTPFQNLKSLDVGQEMEWPIVTVAKQTVELLQMNSVLESFKFPFNPYVTRESLAVRDEGRGENSPLRYFTAEQPNCDVTWFGISNTMFKAIKCIRTHIENRAGSGNNLNFFDFASYHNFDYKQDSEIQEMADKMAAPLFRLLCGICIENGVELRNVSAFWFKTYEHILFNLHRLPEYGIPVVSMVNLDPDVFSFWMFNLTRIEIRATSVSSVGSSWKEHQQRPDWENLKSLDISVDSKTGTGNLFQFFFKDVRRVNLTELKLKFLKDADQVAIPKCDDIADSCPNLKKIAIINWPGKNKALVNLWNGLRALEEVTLEGGKNVGNVTFVGEDTSKPVFFGLKKLRKFSLLGLDKMPKITDLLFSLVIQHLPLTHLILTSDAPVESVTPTGIQYLLTGSFATCVQKFPFRGWSLANVSSEEFKKLEQMFRSYEMR